MRPIFGNETGRTGALSSIVDLERIVVPKTACNTFEDEIEQTFPGSVLSHVLTITSRDQLSVALQALVAVRASGGCLEALSLTRCSGTFEHRLKLVGLRPNQVRLLTERIAAMPCVDRAHVEHQLLRM